MPAVTVSYPSEGTQERCSGGDGGATPAKLSIDGPRKRRTAGQLEGSRRTSLSADTSSGSLKGSRSLSPAAHEDTLELLTVQTPEQNGACRSYAQTRSIARASRPPVLPLHYSSHSGLDDASDFPPERLSTEAPTVARQRGLTAPSDAPGTLETFPATASVCASLATLGHPNTLEPSSARSHRNLATFGGDGDLDCPRSRISSFTSLSKVPRPAAAFRVRHLLPHGETPFARPPRLTLLSHPSSSVRQPGMIPPWPTPLPQIGKPSIGAGSAADYPASPQPHTMAEDIAGGDAPSEWNSPCTPAADIRNESIAVKDLREILGGNS